MQEKDSPKDHHKPKSNRPHCFYLWYIHGKAVCSEEVNSRSCAYPFWNCPVRIKQDESLPEEHAVSSLQTVSSSEFV